MRKIFISVFIFAAIFNFGFVYNIDKSQKALGKKISLQGADILSNVVVVKMKENPEGRLYKNDAVSESFNKLLLQYRTYSIEKIFPAKKELSKSSAVSVDLSKYYFIRYIDNISPITFAEELSANPLVEYAEPQFIRKPDYTPNDPYFNQGTQWALKKIQAELAWNVTKGSKDIIIGIVDTGIDWTHPDLANNIWINTKEIAGNGIDDDNNGFIDDVRGWDFGGMGSGINPTPDNDPNEDRADHGSHVAGIASAVTDNGIGVAGIGFNCKIMAVKVSQDNRRDTDNTAFVIFGYQGIVYAADNGAQIINCSWGGGGYSKFEDDMIHYANQKGALVVTSSGNNSSFRESYYPAAYEHVLAVGSTDGNDARSPFSNWGYYVDVSAPGEQIYSTWKGNSYVYLQGTSMASPYAAGVAALVKSVYPNYTPDQVAEKVRVSSDNIDGINAFFAGKLGFGRINAYKAVTISSPAIRVISYEFDDKTFANGNSVLESGEKIALKLRFKNYLDPAQNAAINLTSNSPYIRITKGTMTVGSIGTLAEIDNETGFEFEIDNGIPLNSSTQFTITFNALNYEDKQTFSVNINPSYANTSANNIEMTITSEGNLGFNDFPNNKQGMGFKFNKGDNLLFEGALMLGVSSFLVSDCARNEGNSQKNNYFKTITPIHFTYGGVSDEDGITVFNDDNAPGKIGIKTTLNSYSYKSEPNGNFVLLKYTFENTNSSGTAKFYPGLFFDWDLGLDGSDNIVRFDNQNKMAYVFAKNGSPATYAGVVLLDPISKTCFWPIKNDGDELWGIYDGFSVAEKYESLNSGIRRDSAGPGDISFVIGAGETNIESGKQATVIFAMVAGNNLTELREAAANARKKLGTLSADEVISLPESYEVSANYPNPFNPSTNIKFVLKEKGSIKIDVFDLNGTLVKSISKSDLPYGEGNVSINLTGKATGVYYYRFTAFNSKNERTFVKHSKFVLLK